MNQGAYTHRGRLTDTKINCTSCVLYHNSSYSSNINNLATNDDDDDDDNDVLFL